MKTIAIIFFSLLCSPLAAQTCTTTLSSGADIASAISSAAGGDVICLGNGSYGSSSTTSINSRKSSRVIIRSTSGVASDVTVSLKEIYRSSNLEFKNVSMGGHNVADFGSTPCNDNLTYNGVTFTSGPMIFDRGCGATDAKILITGSTVANAYQSGGAEGSIYLTCQPSCSGAATVGLAIEFTLFDGSGACSDAIQLTANHSGVRIGPGNIFRDWVQGSCSPHVDAIQQVGNANVTIEGNYFTNNTIHLGFYDGADNTVVRNNIFDGQNSSGVQTFQIGGIQGMTFVNNTLRDIVNTSIGTKTGQTQNSSWVIRDNLLVNSSISAGGDQPGCGSGCSCTYNQMDSSSSLLSCATSNNNTTNTSPTFTTVPPTAPSNPTDSRIGWKLAVGSNGRGSGSDGGDRGTRFFNPPAPTGVN